MVAAITVYQTASGIKATQDLTEYLATIEAVAAREVQFIQELTYLGCLEFVGVHRSSR
jgi:hypothetical protein